MYNLKQETETSAASLCFRVSATSAADEPIEATETDTAYEDTVNSFGTALVANLAAFNNLT